MTVALIRVPYDSGQREQRMGAGPDALVRAGAATRLNTASGQPVVPSRIETDLDFPLEAGVGFDLARKLSGDVARARRGGAFPVVLAGNCLSALGTLGGLSDVPRLGIVWLDAHGDLNTPETSPSGFIDGMGLAVATGRCWRALAAEIPGFDPVPDRQVCHLGARDLDPAEQALLAAEGHFLSVDGETWATPLGAAAVETALDSLAERVDGVYLHIDMDVHRLEDMRTSPYAVPGGPDAEAVHGGVAALADRIPILAANVTNYAPHLDASGAGQDAALALLDLLGQRVAARR